jgi:hypothetical protein
VVLLGIGAAEYLVEWRVRGGTAGYRCLIRRGTDKYKCWVWCWVLLDMAVAGYRCGLSGFEFWGR